MVKMFLAGFADIDPTRAATLILTAKTVPGKAEKSV